MFLQQKARSQQLLKSLHWKPLAPSYLLPALQVELANWDSICTSYKPLIITATQLLKREPSFNGMSTLNGGTKRSLLPFLGDALSWLTRTAMTRHQGYQEEGQPTQLNANSTTGYFSTCHLHTKHHQICHAHQQTTHQHGHGSSPEDTQ